MATCAIIGVGAARRDPRSLASEAFRVLEHSCACVQPPGPHSRLNTLERRRATGIGAPAILAEVNERRSAPHKIALPYYHACQQASAWIRRQTRTVREICLLRITFFVFPLTPQRIASRIVVLEYHGL